MVLLVLGSFRRYLGLNNEQVAQGLDNSLGNIAYVTPQVPDKPLEKIPGSHLDLLDGMMGEL